MQESIVILIPESLENNIGLLEGVCRRTSKGEKTTTTYFITSDKVFAGSRKAPENFIGLCTNNTPDFENEKFAGDWIHVNIETKKVTISCQEEELTSPICTFYDFESFSMAESWYQEEENENEVFFTLWCLIRNRSLLKRPNRLMSSTLYITLSVLCIFEQLLDRCNYVLKYSAVFIKLRKDVKNIIWIFRSMKFQSSRLQTKNVVFSSLVDLILGYILLQFILKNQDYISKSMQETTTCIIKGLKNVLNKLSDSPAGLKLNYALNRTLAVFFFYQISLWGSFIEGIFGVIPKFRAIFVVIAHLGFSFQLSILIDLISFLTFHVYCIYVYAARFYGVQLYAINALWKLFIGRKYNPLRDRVDSFQYTNNQLFVGTLAFTVFLFLLPTTLIYYVVFTMFRLWVIVINKFLGQIVRLSEAIPIYLVILKLFNSGKLKGKICLRTKKVAVTSTLQIHATLEQTPFAELVNQHSSPVLNEQNCHIDKFQLKECLLSICTAKLI